MQRSEESGQWPHVAALWKLLGPPLRPSRQDLELVADAIGRWSPANATSLKFLVLGVTPEFTGLELGIRLEFHAIDRTPSMIAGIWPGPKGSAKCGDWRSMPWTQAVFDVAICDGGLQLLDYPAGITAVARELQRVLKPGGLFIVRLFCAPVPREDPESVLSQLFTGAIADLNELKLRLNPALQINLEDGVRLGDTWKFLHDRLAPWNELAARLGWSLEHLQVIDAYRENDARMHFFDASEAIRLITNASDLEPVQNVKGSYRMADRCPTLVFRRKLP
jgi:SAM-dependent methyltransferase